MVSRLGSILSRGHPRADAPPAPTARHVVRSRMWGFAAALDGLADQAAGRRDPMLDGCLVMPCADLVIAGTGCRRPLLFPEGEAIARETGLDVLLLRHDLDRGTSFDIRFGRRPGWLCHYVAWRWREGDLWLIPEVGATPSLRASSLGLAIAPAPFRGPDQRRAGIIRAITSPSFAGRGR